MKRDAAQQTFPVVNCAGFGGYCRAEQEYFRPERLRDVTSLLESFGSGTIALRGSGKSYGDAALNASGLLLSLERLDRFVSFDAGKAIVRAEAGVSVLDVMRVFVPRGLTLAVAPGVSQTTLGGCAAFDVHSKNHWRAGGFGNSIIAMRMLTADGSVIDCSREENPDLFFATIGGMGLTGIILQLDIQLHPLPGTRVESHSVPFAGIDILLQIFERETATASHVVAWLDLLNGDKPDGFVIASAITASISGGRKDIWRRRSPPPLGLLSPFYNSLSNQAFNRLCALKHKLRPRSVSDLRSFLFPWDSISNWNKLYGKEGFVEYQCCVPIARAEAALSEITRLIMSERKRFPAYFAAIKRMREGEGMLSFPLDGYSLLMDFPVRPGLWEFLDRLDEIVVSYRGRVYLAKDGRLSPEAFARMYPRLFEWLEVRRRFDPTGRFASDMARRLKLVA